MSDYYNDGIYLGKIMMIVKPKRIFNIFIALLLFK